MVHGIGKYMLGGQKKVKVKPKNHGQKREVKRITARAARKTNRRNK